MQLKRLGWFLLPALLLIQAIASQAVPSANSGHGEAFQIGVGLSSFNADWGHGRMLGGTLWGDWRPSQAPGKLQGFGLEIELRDVSLDRGTQPSNFREDTGGGGILYSWPHFAKIRPYGKLLISDGSIDFVVPNLPSYTHDTRIVYAPGGGIEYRAYGTIRVRADYEYQIWPQMFGGNLDPQGLTFGVGYSFGSVFGR